MLESKEYTGHSSWVPEAFYAQFQFQSSLKKWPVFSCLCLRPLAKDDCVGRRMQEKTSGTQGSCGHALLHNENAWKARNFSGIKEQFSPVLALSRLGVPETIQVKSPRLFLLKHWKHGKFSLGIYYLFFPPLMHAQPQDFSLWQQRLVAYRAFFCYFKDSKLISY